MTLSFVVEHNMSTVMPPKICACSGVSLKLANIVKLVVVHLQCWFDYVSYARFHGRELAHHPKQACATEMTDDSQLSSAAKLALVILALRVTAKQYGVPPPCGFNMSFLSKGGKAQTPDWFVCHAVLQFLSFCKSSCFPHFFSFKPTADS